MSTDNGFSRVFPSPGRNILHRIMPVFTAVLHDGLKITSFQCWFSSLHLKRSDPPRFSDLVIMNIMGWLVKSPNSLQLLAEKLLFFFALFINFFAHTVFHTFVNFSLQLACRALSFYATTMILPPATSNYLWNVPIWCF